MSSCYLSSRAAAACGFNLEHMIKWPSCTSSNRTTTTTTTTTSNSSTNSPIAISTRKPRKPRKRPNQTYNEAAALLSMACPNIFTSKTTFTKYTKPNYGQGFFNEPPELIENLELQQEKPFSLSKVANSCQNSNCGFVELSEGCLGDFDSDSILDEEIEHGIDSIMGDSNLIQENIGFDLNTSCYGYPFGFRNGVKALRNDNQRDWWCSPMVDISQTLVADCQKLPVGKTNKNTKKKKKVEELMKSESEFQHLSIGNGHRLMLKLDYDGVMNAWTNKGLPLPETSTSIHANIDLFSKNGGWSSESSVTRSVDKNHFKKIRSHQGKNVCSDGRPRCKDLRDLHLSEDMVQDRSSWRHGIIVKDL